MSVKIRLARGGAKKRPFYSIVIADVRSPRDGRFIEKVGTYNPMLPREHPDRVTLKQDRIRHWLDRGARPTDRVARFLGQAEMLPAPAIRETPKKSAPKVKAQERLKEAAEAAAAAEAESAAMPIDNRSELDRTLVCVGEIVAPHGVRGLVRVRSFTADPGTIGALGRLTAADRGRTFGLTLLSPHRGQWLARVDGVDDRDAALALSGTRLHVDRATLPPTDEEEFYHADLIGLRAERSDGSLLGAVRAVHDFGAGDVLEIVPATGLGARTTMMIPFTRTAVPVIDLTGGRLVIEPPAGLLDGARHKSSGDGEASKARRATG